MAPLTFAIFRITAAYLSVKDAKPAVYLELLSVSTEAKTVLYFYILYALPLHSHCQKELLT